ncbi:MAG: alpha/beta fold hydrolase, partial [Pseudomonadota bacterium]
MIQAPGLASTFKEVFAVLDVAGAAVSSMRLQRLPRCDGQRIVTLPGYGFGDEPMLPLRLQLRALGGTVEGWGCGINHGRVRTLLPKATARVAEVACDGPLTLIGWSLGGFIAREIAREHPDLIRRVITLGTPVQGGPRYTILRGVYERLG